MKVALLIDADNVSADVLEQAVAHAAARHGAIHVRRAYGTAECAVKQQKLFKRLGIRPVVNLAAGKNSTDIALAVDAIDLVAAERPDVVVIVSSDSDFAPLVLRLREKGCRVEGIGQEGKTGDEVREVYDDFVDLPHGGSRARATAKARGPAKRAAAKAPAAKAAAKPSPPPAPAAPPPLPEEVARVLEVLPELAGGAKVQLRIAAERLRAQGLLAKSAPSTKLFRKHPALFVLTPERQPNQVQFSAPR